MIMSALPIILAIALIILAVVIKSNMPLWKGIAAEKRVYHKMQELPEEYNIFNDLLFQNNLQVLTWGLQPSEVVHQSQL